MTIRVGIPFFEIGNPYYANASVSVYEADPDTGLSTGVLATLYDDLTGAGTLTNPLTLSNDGHWDDPPYVDGPIVCTISGAEITAHTTGVIQPPPDEIGEDTAFTPVLKFGGATTGITYSVQQGIYTEAGHLVHFTATIGLSSKGSATGNATITGLPFLPSSQGNYGLNIGFSANFSGLTGLPHLVLKTNSADGHIDIYAHSTDGATETTHLTDAHFANSTFLYFSGWYRKAA